MPSKATELKGVGMRDTYVSVLSRRAVAASLITICTHSPSSLLAAPPPSSCTPALPTLLSARETLGAAEGLLSASGRWSEAKSRLDAIDDAALQSALDACVESKTFKEQAMNNAAFIVYYEERRYGDLRLEPQAPSLRAEQNGRKKEFLRALADEKAELNYLLKSGDVDANELLAYAGTARKALDEFLALVQQGGAAAAERPS
jgi:hypothetical protein